MDHVWGYGPFLSDLTKSMESPLTDVRSGDVTIALKCIIYSLIAINNIFTAYKSLFWKYFLT